VNGLYQLTWAVMFKDDSSHSGVECRERDAVSHASRDHENSDSVPLGAEFLKQVSPELFAKVIVQQNDINGGSVEKPACFSNSCAVSHNLKIRFRLQQAHQALAEESVIVDQHYANRIVHGTFSN
jgi:hypothetical protein